MKGKSTFVSFLEEVSTDNKWEITKEPVSLWTKKVNGTTSLWSNDFARNRIGHLNILGGFHIVLGIIDMVAPLLIRDSVGFLVYGGMTFFNIIVRDC